MRGARRPGPGFLPGALRVGPMKVHSPLRLSALPVAALGDRKLASCHSDTLRLGAPSLQVPQAEAGRGGITLGCH
jgi:hypothetical protein